MLSVYLPLSDRDYSCVSIQRPENGLEAIDIRRFYQVGLADEDDVGEFDLVKPELAPFLQGRFFLMMGLTDAVPMIGVGLGMYMLFAI